MNERRQTARDVALEEVRKVPVDWLTLDPLNPRLGVPDGPVQDQWIIAQLYRADDLGELLESIAANGYLDIEPLIVLLDGDRLCVLEGNRRLAAIQLFRDPGLVGRIHEAERVQITLPEIADRHRLSLEMASVYRVAERNAARSFLGFKHINGAARWTSYAKAKFAADWHRDGVPLEEIARRIGDRHDTIRRMVSAIYVLEQAKERGLFDIQDRMAPRFNFSHLYTALSRGPYKKFLGLDGSGAHGEADDVPVPLDKMKELAEVLTWLYGSRADDVQPVVQTQNPDIKRLGEVIEHVEGIEMLRAGESLSDAHESIQPAASRFSSALLRARGELRDASNSLRGFDGRAVSLLGVAADIKETAQTVYDRMQTKAKEVGADTE